MTAPDDLTTTSQRTPGRKGVLAGAGIVLACAIACSLPLILAGGLAAGVGAFLAGGEVVALGVVLLVAVAVGTAMWVRRRRSKVAAATTGGGCGC